MRWGHSRCPCGSIWVEVDRSVGVGVGCSGELSSRETFVQKRSPSLSSLKGLSIRLSNW